MLLCPTDEQNCPMPKYFYNPTAEDTTLMHGTSTAAATRASTASVDATTSSGIMASTATFLQGKTPSLSTK